MENPPSKDKLLKSILVLVYHNIYCSDPNDDKWSRIAENGFKTRILGFRAETEFVRKISSVNNIKIFSGPTLLPNVKNGKPTDSPILFTIDTKPFSYYRNLYNRYPPLSPHLFYIRYAAFNSGKHYEMQDLVGDDYSIPVPSFKCYRFTEDNGFTDVTSQDRQGLSALTNLFTTRHRNRLKSSFRVTPQVKSFVRKILSNFDYKELNHTLAVRTVFDGYLGFNVMRGRPADIDCIIKTQKRFYAFEVKEKDLSKTPPHGFGMDTSRAMDIVALQKLLGIKFYYVVKHVNNQKERTHIGWKRISINNFIKYCNHSDVSGGSGMMTANSDFVKTIVTPVSKYKSF